MTKVFEGQRMTYRYLALAALGFAFLASPSLLAQDEAAPATPEVEVDRIDPLGDIAEDMNSAARSLDRGESGEKVQTSQRRAIAKLDQLIESLKKR